jgi:hypothetical protein
MLKITMKRVVFAAAEHGGAHRFWPGPVPAADGFPLACLADGVMQLEVNNTKKTMNICSW